MAVKLPGQDLARALLALMMKPGTWGHVRPDPMSCRLEGRPMQSGPFVKRIEDDLAEYLGVVGELSPGDRTFPQRFDYFGRLLFAVPLLSSIRTYCVPMPALTCLLSKNALKRAILPSSSSSSRLTPSYSRGPPLALVPVERQNKPAE